MKRPSDGLKLLHALLDRHERGAGATRRIVARPTLVFASSAERETLNQILNAAQDAGAVAISYDRDAPHLIASVTLADPARLYTHLARTPAAVGANAAIALLNAIEPATDTGIAIRRFVAERWRAGKRALGLRPETVDEALALIRAADAAMTGLPGAGLALRTRSTRLLGDSKALERALPKIVAFLKMTGQIPSDLHLKEAARVLGLEKFPQPVLIAGPLVVLGTSIGSWPYVGVPPEGEETIAVEGAVLSILTIENLESFNRHVRECREPGDIAIYLGGFPAPGVVSVLRKLIELSKIDAIYHWGDVDPGGLRIGAYLERVLPVPVRPHLMSIATVAASGRTPDDRELTTNLDPASAFAELSVYLAAPGARLLEQELIDPAPVAMRTV